MKYILLLLFLISKIVSEDKPDVLEIDDLYEILLNDKEYQIQNEIVIISIPNTLLKLNIRATFKGDSEFEFSINNTIFEKITEKTIILNDYLKDPSDDDEEELFLVIKFKEPENHNVTLFVECLTVPYESLFANVTKEYCEKVKENIKQLMEKAYIYLDYAKNPKQPKGFPNYFEKVDFIKDLNDIQTENRTYYEFYRDIKEALGKFRDLHLNIISQVSPNGIDLSKSFAVLPFTFYIKKDDNDEKKLYILPDEEYTKLFYPELSEKLEEIQDYPLSSINESNPFDYIQNFIGNRYEQTKNRHATFSFNMNFNNIGMFSLSSIPLTQEEMSNINFKFENGESLTLSYHFTIFKNDSYTKEFNNFYEEQIKKTKIIFPSFSEIEKKYLIHKGVIPKDFDKKKINLLKNKNMKDEEEDKEDKKDEDEKKIEWDIEFIDGDGDLKFKCKEDNENEVNVLYQNSFYFENVTEALISITTCCEIFQKNEFPIIVIESKNGGGYGMIGLLLIEFLNTAIDTTEYLSYKPDKIVFEEGFGHTNPDTCETANPIKDQRTETDDYGDGITHIRTPIYNFYDKYTKTAFNHDRNILYARYGNKKPTDIIVFTDGFSYSTTCIFIKGLQKVGGAIIVGYLGNPNITGVDEFDGSQAPSPVQDYNNTEYSKELKKLGYKVHGITSGETFLNPYEKNQIPREYQLNPVDERVDIYEPYSDFIYDDFISEGLKIFKKYKTECNPKNKKLTLFTDDCYNIPNIQYSHGGKVCGDDGKWSDKCAPIYCDFGYYFDDYKQKCEINVCLQTGSNDDKNDKNDKGIKPGILALIIIASVIGLILIVVIIIFVYRRIKKRNESTNIESINKGQLLEGDTDLE